MQIEFNSYLFGFHLSGIFEVNGDKVIHHIEIVSVENWVKTDLIRNFTLTLKTPQLASQQGTSATFELAWERMK